MPFNIGPVEVGLRPRAGLAPRPRPTASGQGVLTMDDVLNTMDVVGVIDNEDFGHVLVTTPKGGAEKYFESVTTSSDRIASPDKDRTQTTELGSSATKWRRVMGGEEYNDALAGQTGLAVYEKMRRGDASVRASLRLGKTPVLGARWHVVSADPEDKIANDQQRFVEWNLFHGMSISWTQAMIDVLTMLDFGYSFFEKVWQLGTWQDKQYWTLKKLGPRSPLDVVGWSYDENGGPASVQIESWDGSSPGPVLDINKLLVFTFDREVGNVEGIPLLRSAYKHWYFKDNLYKIDAIQKERHGIGIPMIKLPPGFTPADKTIAQSMGKNLRTNEMAHVVLPPMWEVTFIKVEGNAVNVMESIEHHDKKIYDNVLGQFVNEDTSTQDVNIFLRASRVIADIVADVFNSYCIPQMIYYNWPNPTSFPELRVRRIGDSSDLRTLSFALRNLVGAQIIKPDDKLEAWARDEWDVPPADPGTARDISKTPRQAGSNAGLPRQSAPGTSTGAGGQRSNTGVDQSGGKGK